MVIISCITKFHSFNLAEQLERNKQLTRLYTSFAYSKNTLARNLTKRVDRENISNNLIRTNLLIAAGFKIYKKPFVWNSKFDNWVASQIEREKNANVFIGWSGMSYQAIVKAKQLGKFVILERGSSHITYQIEILEEEYKRFGMIFPRNQAIIDREHEEYELADVISVPSTFAAKTFWEKGFSRDKIWINNFGGSKHFNVSENAMPDQKPFRVLYLGSITIQKGLRYLFDAFEQLPEQDFELWIIGSLAKDMETLMNEKKKKNWKIFGFVNHYKLADLISQCHIAVQPSIQEGLSMVIPQILACGLPVIATTNTGGEDIIEEGNNGNIIPIRNAEAIREKILYYHQNMEFLNRLRQRVMNKEFELRTWDDYGDEYLDKILNRNV